MKIKYTQHRPVNDHDEGEESTDIVDTNNHSLPDHPPLESFHSSSNNCAPSSNIRRRSAFACFSIATMAIISISILSFSNNRGNLLQSLFSNAIEFAPLPSPSDPLIRIAFGSCISQHFPQPFWDTIASVHPNITILGGDNVYADCASMESCPSDLARAYEKQMSNPSFMGAMKVLPVIATLDDHDYGFQNADRNNPYKDLAKEYFMDFFQVPKTDKRRTREGVYTSYMYGDVKKGTSVQIILLDVRYSRSERGGPKNENDPETMMGDAQWEWLHEQFAEPADVRIVVSSVQLIATGHPFDCWYVISSREQERFYRVVSDSSYSGTTIILSGDRHVGGIYRHNLTDSGDSSSSSVYEITASSFTHTIPLPPAVPDKYCWTPGGSTSEECDDPDRERLHPYVRVNHFASLSFDWASRVVTADLLRTDATSNSHVGHHRHPDSSEILQSVVIQF